MSNELNDWLMDSEDNTAVMRALEKRVEELEAEEQLFNKTFDAQQMIIEELRAENQRLRNSLADIALKLAGMLRGVK